jgi:hypothetical protein
VSKNRCLVKVLNKTIESKCRQLQAGSREERRDEMKMLVNADDEITFWEERTRPLIEK